jgi:hypothetical protein
LEAHLREEDSIATLGITIESDSYGCQLHKSNIKSEVVKFGVEPKDIKGDYLEQSSPMLQKSSLLCFVNLVK